MAAGSAPTASPIARNVSPTATMWAWYQVVDICAAYQKTVPNAKKSVVAEPDREPDGEPPERPPADGDVDRGEDREDRLVVRREAPQRHERQQDDRRQRRERQEAAGDPVGRRDRQDVLEVGIAVETAARLDREADRRVAFEEGGRLPDEVVVVAIDVGRQVDRQRGEDEQAPDEDRRPSGDVRNGRRVRPGIRAGVRRATLCYAPIHLPRSCRSRSR